MERVWQTFATIRRFASGSIWGTVSLLVGTQVCFLPVRLLPLYNGGCSAFLRFLNQY
jgi:hypothetical protein